MIRSLLADLLWYRDWQLPVYNSYNDKDIVIRLLTSNTGFSELAKTVAQSTSIVEQFVRVAAAYQPIGVSYLMMPEQVVIKQAAASPGGTDWTLGQVSILFCVLPTLQGMLLNQHLDVHSLWNAMLSNTFSSSQHRAVSQCGADPGEFCSCCCALNHCNQYAPSF